MASERGVSSSGEIAMPFPSSTDPDEEERRGRHGSIDDAAVVVVVVAAVVGQWRMMPLCGRRMGEE